MDLLFEYGWAGNVRELRNVIESLVIMTRSDEILSDDLPSNIRLLKKINASFPLSLKDAVSKFESGLIKEAIDKYGNSRKAAEYLHVDPATICRKLKKRNYML